MADVFGAILKDQLVSDVPILYEIERDDGLIKTRNASLYFSNESGWSEGEISLLDQVVSPVIDFGAGGGRHSLYLQNKGHIIKSIDLSAGAIDVCRMRGLRDCEIQSIWDLNKSKLDMAKYKTILLLGNNLGLAGSFEGLKSLLQILEAISEPGARLLGNFFSPIPTLKEEHLVYHSKNHQGGKFIGEMKIRINYRGQKTFWMDFYLPTQSEFNEIVNSSNWKLETLINQDKNHQFVKLLLKTIL